MNRHTILYAILLPAVAVAAGGCVDLLRGHDDMDFVVPADRLREVETLDLQAASRISATTPASQPADGAADRTKQATLKMSLAEARAMALEGNLSLKVAVLSPSIAAEGITEVEARFESLLAADVSRAVTDTPVSSALSGMKTVSDAASASIHMPWRTGGSIDLRLPYNRYETDSMFSTLNPSHTADLSVSISQPLLRNAGLRANTHAIRIARWDTAKSEAMTKLEVIRVLAAVDRLYWRLYAAREQLRVRQQEKNLAEVQLARARRGVKAGDKPEIEITRAELGVAERAEGIILARNVVRTRQRELKRLLARPGLEMNGETEVVPQTPPDVLPYSLDADRLVEMAIAGRMELLDLELKVAQDASTIDFARNRTLPLVTVGYTYNINGLGANASSAFDLMFQRRFEDHRFGVHVEVPLGNQAARSRLRRAILTRIQTLATLQRRKSLIAKEVLDSIDLIQANWQRVIAARRRVELAERVLAGERRQFDLGLRTSTEVLNAQASLADARSAEVNAVVEYQAGQVDLAVATGTLLGADRVRWAPANPTAKGKE